MTANYNLIHTYTVRSFMTELMLFKSSPKRRTADRSISISVSVHLALRTSVQRENESFTNYWLYINNRTKLIRTSNIYRERRKECIWNTADAVSASHPAGDESATGCSCMVSSPSLENAAPAAEKISPTWLAFICGFYLSIT